jgi:hypothetical protein
MEERIMTNEQFRAIIEMVVQIVKYAPNIDEAVKRLYEVRQKLEKEKNSDD